MPTFTMERTVCTSRNGQRQALAREMIRCANEDIRDALELVERQSYRNALILMMQSAEKSFKAIMLHLDPDVMDGYDPVGYSQRRSAVYLHTLTDIRAALCTDYIADPALAENIMKGIEVNMAYIADLLGDRHAYNNLRYPRPFASGVGFPRCERPTEAVVNAFKSMNVIANDCLRLLPFVDDGDERPMVC